MDKFFTSRASQPVGSPPRSQASGSRSSQGVRKPKPKQARLNQCKKVVKLKASRHVINPEEVQSLCAVLESPSSAAEELIVALRHLDCLQLHTDELTGTQAGVSVRKLRKHPAPNVSHLARGIVDKWRRILLDECKL